MSVPGKQDGLFWKVKEGEEPSPLGELAAEAAAEGYTRSTGKPTPFRGYYFQCRRFWRDKAVHGWSGITPLAPFSTSAAIV